MKFVRIGRTLALGAVAALGGGGCISPDSPLIQESAEGCDEFRAGEEVPAELEVDPTVRAFMTAASDFATVADDVRQSVFAACVNIATDLGAEDTWSAIEDEQNRLSNSDGTGACDAAGARIEDLLADAGTLNAHVALAVSRGECHVNFEQQAKCDASCAIDAPCDPGTVETRCEPGDLSVMCQVSCSAGAYCMGTPEAPANCMGQCESTCTGACKGTCFHADGRVTQDDPSCMGKCTSACNGTCRGRCKVDQPVECGAGIRCSGGCSGSFSDPVCTTEIDPPDCELNAECHAACAAQAAADAVCDPPLVEVFADVAAAPELEPLVATLQQNLPALLSAAETRGKLAVEAAHRLGQTGEVIANDIESLSGKSLACLGAASTAVGRAIGRFDVSARASGRIAVTCHEGME